MHTVVDHGTHRADRLADCLGVQEVYRTTAKLAGIGGLEDGQWCLEDRGSSSWIGRAEEGDNGQAEGVREMDPSAIDPDHKGRLSQDCNEFLEIGLTGEVFDPRGVDAVGDGIGDRAILRSADENGGAVRAGCKNPGEQFDPMFGWPAFRGVVGTAGEANDPIRPGWISGGQRTANRGSVGGALPAKAPQEVRPEIELMDLLFLRPFWSLPDVGQERPRTERAADSTADGNAHCTDLKVSTPGVRKEQGGLVFRVESGTKLSPVSGATVRQGLKGVE